MTIKPSESSKSSGNMEHRNSPCSEDLQVNTIENDSNSPFYGIDEENQLVARISLYRIDVKYDRYFKPAQDYYERRNW